MEKGNNLSIIGSNFLKNKEKTIEDKQNINEIAKFIQNKCLTTTEVAEVIYFLKKDNIEKDAKIKSLEAELYKTNSDTRFILQYLEKEGGKLDDDFYDKGEEVIFAKKEYEKLTNEEKKSEKGFGLLKYAKKLGDSFNELVVKTAEKINTDKFANIDKFSRENPSCSKWIFEEKNKIIIADASEKERMINLLETQIQIKIKKMKIKEDELNKNNIKEEITTKKKMMMENLVV